LIPSVKERQLQVDKVKHFLLLAQEILEKHFDLWVNAYIFFALFSESNTAQVVAQFLLEQQAYGFADNGICESNIHGQTISLTHFRSFLEERCKTNKQEILTSVHLLPLQTRGGIRAIADGLDMWATPCPMRLATSKSHYQESFAALATNSHMAERGVKASNFCTLTNRPEYLSSCYGTARSGLVEPIHFQATIEREQNTTRGGNRYVRAGKVGERKRTNGEIYVENAKSATESVSDCAGRICGAHQSKQTLTFVTERHKRIANACDKNELKTKEWKRMRGHVSEKNNSYCVSRVHLKTEEYKNSFHIERTPNIIQRREGADVTPFMQGKVPYGKLNKTRDWENLKIELAHRHLLTTGIWTECKLRLMEHEGDKQNFKVLSSAIFPWQ
jgi:hypothetical protein